MTTVINQHEKIIDGTACDTIINAVDKDKTTISIDGHIIIINSVSVSGGDKIIKVEI